MVEVYYADTIEIYTRELDSSGNWNLNFVKSAPNFFGEVPVVAYYFGDEMMGLIEPVMPLIDCYDILLSDSMNEFDRFANAYLILKKMSLVDPLKRKEPGALSQALAKLKRYRVFELQDKDSDVKFLMKDIPFGFIQFMTQFVQKQIHTQSHVPDFAGEKFTGASGIAIQRLLFDFENVCSDAEADFDVGLYERIRLISIIYKKLGRAYGDYSAINISHKRNSPLNLQEFATTASLMKQAGFSRYVIADIMPDDVIPDVEEELKREDEDAMRMMPTVEQNQLVNELSKSFEQNPTDESQQTVDESLSNGGTLIE
jgi:SPP1 family phage portal protein